MERKYFLKNSNLMEEMQKSKYSYCCYEKEEYANYDIICGSYKLITPNMIIDFFNKHKDREYVLIRVMTSEHVMPYLSSDKINLQELKMSPFKHILIRKDDFETVYKEYGDNLTHIHELNLKNIQLKEEVKENNRHIRNLQQEKVKQVPFKEANNKLKDEISQHIKEIEKLSDKFSTEILKYAKEVLRSHWKGESIEKGEYCLNHGKLTDDLVYMIIMLVDQYARSGNWAGYTYLDDMKGAALVQLCDVALKFEEIKSNNVFAYFTTVASNRFKATLNSEKVQSKIKSRKLQDAGYNPSYGEQVNETFKQIYYDEQGNAYTKDDIDESDDNLIDENATE